jgi:hypothetical protein
MSPTLPPEVDIYHMHVPHVPAGITLIPVDHIFTVSQIENERLKISSHL